MIWWRRGEPAPQALPPIAAREDEDVEMLGARVLGGADDPSVRPVRPPPASTRTDPGSERSPGSGFHVEHGDRAAAGPVEGARQPPIADPEALAWRWRRGQREPRPAPPTDEHQAVTVRPVGAPVTEDAPRHGDAPAPRPRQSAPVRRVGGGGSAPREELERARHLATGAWQQPPEDAAPWVRIAEELRRP
ncbi:MAG: hypothetical protein KY469_08975 [Actinobacteria bacterium]|nr:hypothetical protein [Actinomycetota bacterium]